MNSKNRYLLVLLLMMAVVGLVPVHAAVPEGIGFQAYLTNSDGTPVDADVAVTFAAYNVDIGGVPLWSQSGTLTVDQGLLSVDLGNPANPFPAGLFDGPVFVGMFVAGEELMPRREIKSTGFAYKAADADTLNGVDAASLDESGDITTLQGDLASTDANVASNQSDIAAVAADVVVNDSRITTLEATGGDITAVLPGAGLEGGASAGNATLGIAAMGVTNAMIANGAVDANKIASGAVGSSEIADGAVGPLKLDQLASYTMGAATINGTTQVNGPFRVDSGADIFIYDDYNGFRWSSADGTTQFGSIEMRELDVTLRDVVRNRYLIRSNANGIGIGTFSPSATHDVTMPSLNVTGNIEVGLQRVTASYVMSSTTANCHAHGNLTCYYGSGTVQCPVGTRVLGGGASGSTPRYGAIGISYPSSNTSYTCGTSYDLADSTRTCYAICARLE